MDGSWGIRRDGVSFAKVEIMLYINVKFAWFGSPLAMQKHLYSLLTSFYLHRARASSLQVWR